jgi:hypothetical protein
LDYPQDIKHFILDNLLHCDISRKTKTTEEILHFSEAGE